MTVYIPWGLIAIFVSLYIFYQSNRKSQLRREERREQLNNRRQELLEKLIEAKNKKSGSSQTKLKETDGE
ncbi:MAG TPA: hypothetical protein VN726_10135 [Hanamia sp.]|nr:hypothetical protein [Hanamia sp.]